MIAPRTRDAVYHALADMAAPDGTIRAWPRPLIARCLRISPSTLDRALVDLDDGTVRRRMLTDAEYQTITDAWRDLEAESA